MSKFDYFVVFAEMRTGSNFLEANLNCFEDLACLGEAFNPHFIGYPKSEAVLGVTLSQREENPHLLLDAVMASDGTNGFRYFHDHDPRVLDRILSDHRCGKIILTRNPVDSFVSWKIAQQTDQWKLTNAKHAKSGQIQFDAVEFAEHLKKIQDFQLTLMRAMQTSGQTAFYVAYEDLQDIDVVNGMARFLGSHHRIEELDKKLKKQNPAALSSKVSNFNEMQSALARLDRFDLHRTPNFEPRRGPMVARYVAAAKSDLVFLPIKSGPTAAVTNWLCQLDGVAPEALRTGLKQGDMRQWMQDRPGHRSFAVVRHPVARAHAAFCEHFLEKKSGGFSEIRQYLKSAHGLKLPARELIPETDKQYDMAAHEKAFIGFLKFVKTNLNAQTSLRVDPAWASQAILVQGMSEFAPIDAILREDQLDNELPRLAMQAGASVVCEFSEVTDPYAERLAAIYSPRIEKAARNAYARDYLGFGFSDWTL